MKLGDQWVEVIDGKEHMVKAVEPIDLCQGCSFNCNQGGCCWAGFDDCGMGSKFIIRDIGILKDGLLPCPFCGEYPYIEIIEPHTHSIATFMPDCDGTMFVMCGKCNCAIAVDHCTEIQKAKDAWNRRV